MNEKKFYRGNNMGTMGRIWTWLLLVSACDAFAVNTIPHSSLATLTEKRQFGSSFTPKDYFTALGASLQPESDETPARRKKRTRRKKKEPVNEDLSLVSADETAPIEAAQEVMPFIPRTDEPMKLEVQDIREFVPKEETPMDTPTRSKSSYASSVSLDTPSSPLDDSLEKLLADAREMEDGFDGKVSMSDERGEDNTTIKQKIGKVLSTIVTADFFVVCAFLLWFLLGIFARAVFNNDAIQIAFNNNFQTLVQPALGVLMIGSAAGGFFEEKEEGV